MHDIRVLVSYMVMLVPSNDVVVCRCWYCIGVLLVWSVELVYFW